MTGAGLNRSVNKVLSNFELRPKVGDGEIRRCV